MVTEKIPPDITTACQRCGTCCRKGGPALHHEDRQLIDNGKIQLKDLFTIRPGELAHDNVQGQVQPVTADVIKIKGIDGSWQCRFLHADYKGCTIYNHRPLECRVLSCRDTGPIRELYARQRLSRRDLLQNVAGLWDLVADHETRCSYARLEQLARAFKRSQDVETASAIVEMIGYDQHLRQLVAEKMCTRGQILNFLFGRPLRDTIETLGLKVGRRSGKWHVRPR